MTKKLLSTMTFLLKPPMMKRRSQPCQRVNQKVKKKMNNTSNFQESNCSKLFMNVVVKQTTSTWKFRTRKTNRTPIRVQTRNSRGSGIQRKKVSGRAANQNILRDAEGPRGRAKAAKTPVEGFELFITDEMMQDFVNKTNKNIRNFMTRFHDVLKESSKYTYVKETDLIELKALIGLLYLRAALQLNILKTREIFFHESSHEIFAANMSYNRFAFLICFLEFNDKESRRQRWWEDKFAAIREFFMKMNENNGRCHNPSPYVSVDETLYLYRGRIGMKQYNPSKPAKYRLLNRSLCDPKVPYTYSTLTYAGKPEVIGTNDYYVTGCDEYTKGLVNNFQIYGTLQGRNISLDRYFTSVTLAEWCLERNIIIVGTLKSYRKGVPKEMKGVADREEKSTAFCYSEDEKTMLLLYIDKKKKGKKNILALTTMHNQVKLSVDERKKPHALVF